MPASRFPALVFGLVALLAVAGCPGPDLGGADIDGDGTPDTDDCAPLDPSIHPGADDFPGDFVDSDCDGDDGEDGPGDDDSAGDDDDFGDDDSAGDDDTGDDDDFGDDDVGDDDVGDDDDDDVGDDDVGDDDTSAGPWTWTQVYAVVAANCGCHRNGESSGGQNLGSTAESAYNAWVGVPSQLTGSILRIAPGDPDTSLVIWKLDGSVTNFPFGGEQMPLNGPYLSQGVQDGFRSWVAAGALNN